MTPPARIGFAGAKRRIIWVVCKGQFASHNDRTFNPESRIPVGFEMGMVSLIGGPLCSFPRPQSFHEPGVFGALETPLQRPRNLLFVTGEQCAHIEP